MSVNAKRMSQEYHAAHLAFARMNIVETAARGGRILDLLKAYTYDVVKAESDRYAEEQA